MKKVHIVTSAVLTGVVLSSALVAPAFAWHPEGYIVKKVQDVTTNSALVDANTASDALTVNKGDTLKYEITVGNNGTPMANGNNDMVDTVLKDSLPAGVQLVSNPNNPNVTVKLGTIKPGKSVTTELVVKVTDSTDGDVIDNKACATGNSAVGDAPQQGCDHAVIKVHVPAVVPTPTPTPQVLPAATTLPNTGAGSTIAIAAIAAILGYASWVVVLKRKNAKSVA